MRESECKVGSVQQLQLKRVEWLRVALLRVELSKFGGTSSAYGVNGRHAEAMPRPPTPPNSTIRERSYTQRPLLLLVALLISVATQRSLPRHLASNALKCQKWQMPPPTPSCVVSRGGEKGEKRQRQKKAAQTRQLDFILLHSTQWQWKLKSICRLSMQSCNLRRQQAKGSAK